MKKGIVFMLLLVIIITKANGQTSTWGIEFINSKNNKLNKCKWANFSLDFDDGIFKKLSTLDTSFFYDATKNEIQFKIEVPKTDMTIKIYSDTLAIINHLTDTTLFFSNIISVEDYHPNLRFGEQIIQIHYADFKLFGLSILFSPNYNISVNIFTLHNKQIGWDVWLSDRYSRYIKLYQDNEGCLSYIYFTKENSVMFKIKKTFPGIEMLYLKSKSKLYLSKIREVKATNYREIFMYEDLISYDKKGKMKFSKINVKEY